MNKEELEKELTDLKEKEQEIKNKLAILQGPKHTELIGKYFHTSCLGYEFIIHITNIKIIEGKEYVYGNAWSVRYYKIGDICYSYSTNQAMSVDTLLAEDSDKYKEVTEEDAIKKYIPSIKSWVK